MFTEQHVSNVHIQQGKDIQLKLYHDMKKTYHVKWTVDLNEIVEIGPERELEVTQWTADGGEGPVGEWAGGVVSQSEELAPLGVVGLKIEVVE